MLEIINLMKMLIYIIKIQSTFCMTDDETLKVLRISRKDLLDWRSGIGQPGRPVTKRIFDLIMAEQAFTMIGVSIDNIDLHTPIVDNKSLFQSLCEEKIDRERITFFGSRLCLMKPTIKISDPFYRWHKT